MSIWSAFHSCEMQFQNKESGVQEASIMYYLVVRIPICDVRMHYFMLLYDEVQLEAIRAQLTLEWLARLDNYGLKGALQGQCMMEHRDSMHVWLGLD